MRVPCLLFVMAFCAGCPDLSFVPDAGVTSAIDGTVHDTLGHPLAGVRVSGMLSETTTNGSGSFQLSSFTQLDEVLRFERDGFLSTQKQVAVMSGGSFVEVVMIAATPPQKLDAVAGGTVAGSRGARLSVGPGAFVDEEGNEVAGEVEVSLTPLDPANPEELAAYPGELRGLGDEGPVLLQTFGVLSIEVRQGQKTLQLAHGATAEVRVPAPSSGDKPRSARYWIFDEDSGYWREHTTAQYDAASNSYLATVSHLSKCNIDEPIDPYCVRGLVEDKNGRAASGASVRFEGVDYFGSSSDVSDLDGSFCMTVRMNSKVKLTVKKGSDESERTLTTGNDRASYPPMCAVSRCRDLGSIRLGAPPSSDDGGAPVDCTKGGAQDPFWGTCASGLGEMFRCFQPSGECHYAIDLFGGSYTVTYANGAKMSFDFSSITGEMIGQLIGPDGRTCGTLSASESDVTFTTASGQAYQIGSTPKGGTVITCPGGATVTLNGAQRDEMSCAGQVPNESGGASTGCTPAPGSYGAPCDGFECAASLRCCTLLGADGVCLDEDTCEIYQTMGCTSDTDCTGATRCCAAGYFKMCLDVPTCY